MMRVSVIMPTLNEAAIIGDVLDRLMPLRSRGHELVVIDGGSHDDTLALARSSAADRVLTSEPSRARQMNRGASVAQGDVFLFLHADTQLPDGADTLVETALLGSGAQWGYFNVRLSGHDIMFRLIERLMNLRTRLTGIATGDLAIFVRRKAFNVVGGFPEIDLMEDVALSHMLKRLGRPIRIASPVMTSSRRWERNGILSTVLRMWWLRLAYFFGRDPRLLAREYHGTHD